MFELVGHLGRAAPHAAGAHITGEIARSRHHGHKTARVDDAGLANGHAVSAQEI